MTSSLSIEPIGAFRAAVRPPGSKSLTNRALLLAALAEGTSTLRGVLFSDDTRVMLAALAQLGFELAVDEEEQTVRVTGQAGRIPAPEASLHLGNAGTAYRFLTAGCCLGQGTYTLDGIPRMRQRPIGQLVDPLRKLGATIDYLGEAGFPPLRIIGGITGGELTMPATLSSQYISALLQIGPYLPGGLTINFDSPVISAPYVWMTIKTMAAFGIRCEAAPDLSRVTVPPGVYQAQDWTIEPDASNASYFLAAAAIVPGSTCTIEGLGKRSVQGDVAFADVLHQMGAGLLFGRDFITIQAPPPGEPLRGIDIDLNHMPDMAQTLAVVALFAKGTTVIRNVGNLRVKETDRLAALRNELTKLGATVTIEGDDLVIDPPPGNRLTPAAINTYDDHRMAMSFAVAGLASPGIVINDPQCVNKTFPDYFEYLEVLRRGEQEKGEQKDAEGTQG